MKTMRFLLSFAKKKILVAKDLFWQYITSKTNNSRKTPLGITFYHGNNLSASGAASGAVGNDTSFLGQ